MNDDWKYIMAASFFELYDKRNLPDLKIELTRFFARFPNPQIFCQDGLREALLYLDDHSVFNEDFLRRILDFSYDYKRMRRADEPQQPHEFKGVTTFVANCFRVYILRDNSVIPGLDEDTKIFRVNHLCSPSRPYRGRGAGALRMNNLPRPYHGRGAEASRMNNNPPVPYRGRGPGLSRMNNRPYPSPGVEQAPFQHQFDGHQNSAPHPGTNSNTPLLAIRQNTNPRYFSMYSSDPRRFRYQ
jgi:hypothetical protein